MTNVTHQRGRSSPPPQLWQVQLNQTFVTGTEGAFAIKWIGITPQQFRFYFVFTTDHDRNLRVAASSLLPTQSSDATIVIPLLTTVQTLGQLGSYTVGVAQVERRSQVGQTITLAITPVALAGADAPTWRLSPMKQLRVETHVATSRSWLTTNPNGLSEVEWSPSFMSQKVSYVKVIIAGQAVSDRSYVFVRSDDPVVVKVMSKADYLAIAGPANFIP